jgi:acetylornithine deacetylase
MMNLERKVIEAIDQQQDEILHYASKLIQIPSLTGEEGLAQQFIRDTLTDLGCEVDVWEPDLDELRQHAEFQQVPDNYTGRPNVVGILRGTGAGKSMILNGHIDVVPVEPMEKWDHGGPWSGVIQDEMLYGRGASDMKAGLTCFIQALRTLRELEVRLRGDVIVESVVDEERGGNGTLAAVLRGYHADGAIIAEPTNMTITTDNAGALWVRVTVPGKAAHGAYKEYGVNAIEKAMYLYRHLMEYEKERQTRLSTPRFAHYQYPFPINIGIFKSGDWPSSVPDIAIMEGRVGFSPTESHQVFRKEFEAEVTRAAQEDPWLAEHPPSVNWFGLFMDSARIDPNHPLVTTAQEVMAQVLGHPAELKGKAGGTDMRLLVNSGTPCLQIGPGLSSEAHTVNESVPIRNVVDVTKIIALMLIRTCGVH